MKMKITDLTLDRQVYPRNELSSICINSLVDAIERGDPLPAIVIEKKTNRIVDGAHRFYAYQKKKIVEVEVEPRTYKNDAEFFADAVRLNATHGRAFDPNDRRRAVLKLQEYGLKGREIADIVRVPIARLEEWTGQLVRRRSSGESLVLKRGLAAYIPPSSSLTSAQQKLNDRWSGQNATFHVNQLVALLEADITPTGTNFISAMDRLVELWKEARKKVA